MTYVLPDRRPGWCLVFAAGPPWHWRPKFSRTKYVVGAWSFVWLWWGIYVVPHSARTLMLNGMFPRCDRCEHFTTADDLVDCDVGFRWERWCFGCRMQT